ncbi:MAG: hypothetical protein JXB29_03870 [Sedimentisphaerales bacterium]|nr:hypothetical protein [Sedimentisphaerales bacterium]
MNKTGCKALVAMTLIVVIGTIAGCQEPGTSKKSRVISAENMRLKDELAQRQHEIKRQMELVEKCRQENEVLQERFRRNMEDYFNNVLAGVVQENSELKQQLKTLEEQLKELQEKNNMLRQQISQLEEKLKKVVPGTP